MAYETGVASSPLDLRQKLDVFAAANGWTVTTLLDGHKAYSKGNVVVAVAYDSDELFGRGATAVNAGANWNAQPNTSGWQHSTNLGAGPFTAYHFYALTEEGKDLLAVVVEIQSGVFRHFVIADLIKYGSWIGGTYTNSTRWNTSTNQINQPGSSYHRVIGDGNQAQAQAAGHFWCDVDGFTNRWCAEWAYHDYTASDRGPGMFKSEGMTHWMLDAGWQRWNLRTPLLPIELMVNRPSSLRSLVGRIPAMRVCNLRNHTVGEIINIGGSDFQLWPWVARTDSWGSGNSTIYSSAYYGYAYKRT